MDAESYNYRRFSLSRYLGGREGAVEAGEEAPDASLRRLDGGRVRLSELWSRGPLVLEAGSLTCPVFVHKIPAMDELARRFEGRAAFRILYVREAHPGGRQPPHRDAGDKLRRARRLTEGERPGRPVLVDDPEGTVNRAFGAVPNGVVVIGTDGVVTYRADWCDPEEVAAEVERLLAAGGAGRDLPPRDRRDNFTAPSPGLLATALRVLRRAGSPALRDFLSQVPRIFAYRVKRALGPRGE